MFLGRMAARARSQDWFVVGLDLLIVILGVFIGIEVANWNAARQDHAEERRYYAQLLADLRADTQIFAEAEERSRNFDQAADWVLAKLDGKPPVGVSPGRLAAAIHYAGFIFVPVAHRRTYDELISTGNVGLLRDQRIKSDIAVYYAMFAANRQWDALLREQQNVYWTETAGILPRHVLRAAIRADEPQISAKEEQQIWAAARSRPRLPNLLTGMAAHQERVRRDSEDLAVDASKLIDEIERHLASEG